MIEIHHNSSVICVNIRFADNFMTRLLGYMFSPLPEGDDGILFSPAKSIHTFFMRFDLDVVFMKSNGEIVKIIRALKPWRMTWFYFKAHQVLELPAGRLPVNLIEGDRLEVKHV
jgi:uncharacterized protein